MAITLPTSIDNDRTDITSASNVQQRGGVVEEVAFHKHCQKTVLSAYGINGQGATWDVISGLPLSNLGENWLDKFQGTDHKTITDDLASILVLVDGLAGKMNSQFTIKFQDTNRNVVESCIINPWINNKTYTFTFGRGIVIDMEGH